jgi:molecular chaperone DnaK (HSP70)
MDEKNLDPPPYESSQSRTSKIFENRLKIIVGLDYGTTNSGRLRIETEMIKLTPSIGISYVTSDQSSAEKIEIIRTWPGNGPVAGKVPSQMAYKNENVDELDEDQWGFMEPGLKSYLWTKLLLGKDSRSRESQHSSLKDLYGNGFCTLPPGKTAKDVATDYLRGLYKYLEERLQRHDDAVFRITPMEFWITVPALWTDAAKNATIEAAQAAGFGSRAMDEIHIITEPEAAALTVLMPRVGLGAVSGLEVIQPA